VFNIGPEKLILLFVLALIVLGPSRLPDAARTLGRVVGELRRMSGGFQKEVQEALADPKDALTAAVGDLRSELGGFSNGLGDVRSGFRDLGASALGGSAAAPEGQSDSPSVGGRPDRFPHPPSHQPSSTPLPPSPDDPSLN
jgi:Tat protein translocase TatB subunit